MKFDELNLIAPILTAVAEEGYQSPTPIQEQAIPLLLEGRDLVGCAQTGTGKTAAFSIPILQLLTARPAHPAHRKAIRCLILTPTRELALQIGESLAAYGRHLPLKTAVIFGGVSQGAQTETLRKGVDILVATPGRLLDLIGQKFIELHHVEIFVLDEADRMLDMGFAPDVKRVIGMLPEIRQNMLFSATMPPEIVKLVDRLLNEPAKVAVTPVSSTVDAIEQSIYFVGKKEKKLLLIHLLKDEAMRSVLVFTRTKHGADRVAKDLTRAGITVAAIHGDKSQNNRVAALSQFKSRKIRVLVATDIAARGIDVDELSHVVNFDLPNVPETYVHRIGRTGRAGLEGVALSFCDEEEKAYLKDIQKLIGKQVPVVFDQPYPLDQYVEPEPAPGTEIRNGRQGRGRNGQQQVARTETNAPASRRSRNGREPQRRDEVRPASISGLSREAVEAFEREATVLERQNGHTAGRSGKRRNVVRDDGTRSTGNQQLSVRNDNDRSGGKRIGNRRNENVSSDNRRNGSSHSDNRRNGSSHSDNRRSGNSSGDNRRTEPGRGDSRRNGNDRSDNRESGNNRYESGRKDASRHGSGRPIPSRKPSDHRNDPEEEVRTYRGIAAEQPGPFESASFLSQPTRRPKDL